MTQPKQSSTSPKHVSLTPAVFHLPDAVNAVAPRYAENPVVPRGPALAPILGRVRKKIGEALACAATHEAVLLTSSGSGAIAAALGSLVPKGGILVVSNGAYGERQARYAEQIGLRVVHHALPYGERPDPEEIERLVTHHRVGAIGMVHGATSTCSVNPIEEIGAVARRHGVLFFVDAIASVFVEDIDLGTIDVLIASTNKALHANPDLSFVLARRSLLELATGHPGRVPYLDLGETYTKQRQGSHPYTINIRALLEIDAALDVLAEEGGVRGRHAIYAARTELLRSGYEALGLKRFEKPGMPLQSIGTALYLPEGVSYEALAERLAAWDEGNERYEIYAAQGKLSGSVFRIFNMGAYELATYERFLHALGRTLDTLRGA